MEAVEVTGKEIFWKSIEGYEQYTLNSKGQIFSSFGKGRVLRSSKCGAGYLKVALGAGPGNTKMVHRLIAEALIPNPENKPWVNHKNGIKTDNSLENLEWSTISENHQHACDTGLRKTGKLHHWSRKVKRGAEHPSSKLTEEQILTIFQYLRQGLTQKSIAQIFGVTNSMISSIKTGKSWSHLRLVNHEK